MLLVGQLTDQFILSLYIYIYTVEDLRPPFWLSSQTTLSSVDLRALVNQGTDCPVEESAAPETSAG